MEEIVGIKEATGDPERCRAVRHCVPEDFRIYSGDDRTSVDALLAGADGVMSVLSNAYPPEWSALCFHALAGDETEARWMLSAFEDLLEALSLDTNPCTIKYLMSLTHPSHSTEVRLPLVPVGAEIAARIRSGLDTATKRLSGTGDEAGKDQQLRLDPARYTAARPRSSRAAFQLRRGDTQREQSTSEQVRLW